MAYDNTKAIGSLTLKEVYSRVLHKAGQKKRDEVDPGEVVACMKRAILRLYTNAAEKSRYYYQRQATGLSLVAGAIDVSSVGRLADIKLLYSGNEEYLPAYNLLELWRVASGLTGSVTEGARRYHYLYDEQKILVKTGAGITGETDFGLVYVREPNIDFSYSAGDFDDTNKIDAPDVLEYYVEIAAAHDLQLQIASEISPTLKEEFDTNVMALDARYAKMEQQQDVTGK